MKIYGDVRSGNCDKVRFTVDYLRLPYEWVEIDTSRRTNQRIKTPLWNNGIPAVSCSFRSGAARHLQKDGSPSCRIEVIAAANPA